MTSPKELLKYLQSPVENRPAQRRRSVWWKTETPIDFDSVSHIPQVFWELEFHLILIQRHPDYPIIPNDNLNEENTRVVSPLLARRTTPEPESKIYLCVHGVPIHHVSTDSSEERIPECTDKLWYFLFDFWKYIHRCIVAEGTDTQGSQSRSYLSPPQCSPKACLCSLLETSQET